MKILCVVFSICAFFVGKVHSIQRVTAIAKPESTIIVSALKCYFVINGEFTFDEAMAACKSRSSTLAVLNSLSEDQFIRSKVEWSKVPGFSRNASWIGQLWIGLQRISPQPWHWIDGSPLSFSSWLAGEGSSGPRSENEQECIITRKFGWIDSYRCDAIANGRQKVGVGALCQQLAFDIPARVQGVGRNFCGATLLPNLVNKFSMPTSVKKTFSSIRGKFTWHEAVWACKSRGEVLATIRSKEEDAVVRSSVDIERIGGNLWIGLRRIDKRYFEWGDGSPARYTSWFAQQYIDQMPDVNSPNCTLLKIWKVSAEESAHLTDWLPVDCKSDLDTMTNWPGSQQFPIGALCESLIWF